MHVLAEIVLGLELEDSAIAREFHGGGHKKAAVEFEIIEPAHEPVPERESPLVNKSKDELRRIEEPSLERRIPRR
jgi:hypothetical protein